MALDDVQRLQELQLYDLQYQKQDLDLDLKSLEFLHEKVSEQRRSEIDALEEAIKENKNKARDISIKVAEEEKAALIYPQEIDLLRMENKTLQQRINKLRRMLK
jgi:hypothetical protein